MPTAREVVTGTVAAILKHEASEDYEGLAAELDALIKDAGPVDSVEVVKVDPDRRMVYGWASVATVKGEPVVDLQGDVISVDDLREMAHDFIGKRVLGVMHQRDQGIGELRDSVVLDSFVQKALGVDLGREGWFIGFYVQDEETWERVKKGELVAFSIEGVGEREALTKVLDFSTAFRVMTEAMLPAVR